MEQPSLVECIAASFHGTSASRRGADTSGSCDFHGLTRLRPTRCGWVKLVIEGAEVHGSDVGSSESALPLALPTHSLPSKVLLCCVANLLQPGRQQKEYREIPMLARGAYLAESESAIVANGWKKVKGFVSGEGEESTLVLMHSSKWADNCLRKLASRY